MSGATRALRGGALFVFLTTILLLGTAFYRHNVVAKRRLTREKLAAAIGDQASFYQFPTEVDLPGEGPDKVHAVVQYTFDAELQEKMENLFSQYGPDYGAFVAMDAKTGRILSMVSFSRGSRTQENLALRSTFPSASVFKVVTAAAAIENQKFSSDTVIPYNGRNHTLYRGNILRSNTTRWTRYITLKSAFANSINTVFGKIGAYNVGQQELRTYASRFGFDRKIACDMPLQPGHAEIPDDTWGLAEAASGFTRENTMSPLQGALIAATVVNDGTMMEPYVIQSVFHQDGAPMYTAEPHVGQTVMDPKTATEIRLLMKETVVRGTSRKSFRGFFKKPLALLNVGGKTGSLTGTSPPGKYDWFVGYGDDGHEKIAVAALTIHQKLWRVKSSYLGRKAIETYFKSQTHNQAGGQNVALRLEQAK